MGLIERWLGGPSERRMTSDDLARILAYGQESKSGAVVNVDTALRVSTVFACCRRIAGGIARLPLRVLHVDEAGVRRVATDHPLHAVISRRPNARMTSFEWRETSMFHALLAKGAHSYVNRVRGEVREIVPIPPSSILPKYDPKTGEIVAYEVALASGLSRLVDPSAIMRVPGPSWDGREALQVIALARDAIGLSIASEESMAALHKGGIRPSGLLTTDGSLQPATVKRVEEKIRDEHGGSSNSYGLMVLDAGLKFQAMSMTAVDAGTIATREFQVAEIARMFEISPMMIGHPDKSATYASAEAFMQAYVDHTLGPWVERWEQALMRDLLSERDIEEGYYIKLDVRALLRGDARTRAEFYKSGILTGWMTRNEAREKEDMNPLDGLDDPLAPLNMGPGDAADVPPEVVEPPADPLEPAVEPADPVEPGQVPAVAE
jgi:HK97 family phage portal protein